MSERRNIVVWGWALASAMWCLASAGCTRICFSMIAPRPGGSAQASIRPQGECIHRALVFLETTQLKSGESSKVPPGSEGDWPQWFGLVPGGRALPDTNPFMAAFIHHSLELITEEHQSALGLSNSDIALARQMRDRAVRFLVRFRATPGEFPEGGYGFWPQLPKERGLLDDVIGFGLSLTHPEHRPLGIRGPRSITFFPRRWGVTPDADDSALCLAALTWAQRSDCPADAAQSAEAVFGAFRLPSSDAVGNEIPTGRCGAFATWPITIADRPRCGKVEYDPVVNANVLFALGRMGLRDAGGAREAERVVAQAACKVANGADIETVSQYYIDNGLFEYCVGRTFEEGKIEGLRRPARKLACGLVGRALRASGGRYCDRGTSQLRVALAVCTSSLCGTSDERTADAISRLCHEQNVDGGWDGSVLFVGSAPDGTRFLWQSRAITTAFAIEAVSRSALATCKGSNCNE
jgi:hypothetical protein